MSNNGKNLGKKKTDPCSNKYHNQTKILLTPPMPTITDFQAPAPKKNHPALPIKTRAIIFILWMPYAPGSDSCSEPDRLTQLNPDQQHCLKVPTVALEADLPEKI